MKVLHVITGISRKAGGPSRSSQGLVAALCKAGVDAWIYSFDGAEPWIEGVRRFECSNVLNVQNVRMFDLVHIHGIWDRRLHRVAVMCRKAGVPYVVAPRGMLEPWSLKQKWLKKRIARFLYQDRDLKLAAALHATAESEAEQFRALGFKNKIIISPNGVNVPEGDFGTQVALRHANLAKSDVATTPTSSATRPAAVSALRAPAVQSAFCQGSSRRALFVSRMHPKKGVLELVESWARVKEGLRGSKGSRGSSGLDGWTCELVYTMNSEEERAYEQKVKDRILALGMSYKDKDGNILSTTTTSDYDFILTGALDDEKKWEAYARAALFVLPTYSENFGIVVAESLWAGVPVITTKGTPWAELESEKCGWWVDLPEKKVKVRGAIERSEIAEGRREQWMALDSALREAIEQSLNPNNRTILQEMGHRGHQLVDAKYTWEAVAGAMKHGYEQALNTCEFAPCDTCNNYGDTCSIA